MIHIPHSLALSYNDFLLGRHYSFQLLHLLFNIIHHLYNGVVVLPVLLGIRCILVILFLDFSHNAWHRIRLSFLHLPHDALVLRCICYCQLGDLAHGFSLEIVDGSHQIGVSIQLVEHVLYVIHINAQSHQTVPIRVPQLLSCTIKVLSCLVVSR